jgi:hypothetical protein
MFDDCSSTHIKEYLERHIKDNCGIPRITEVRVDIECFQVIKTQMKALGYIEPGIAGHWKLTPYGDYFTTRVLALHH